jgi:hypothetical protein
MPFVPDSTQPGYLAPKGSPDPSPLENDAWIDFLQTLVAGVTGLDGTLVRPRWQRQPPNQPPSLDTTWAAIGITSTEADWMPALIHVDTGDGYDAFQRMEMATLLCSFYGPQCAEYASLLRDGLSIEQNIVALRQNAVGVVEVQDFVRAPELFRNQFRDRMDVSVIFRREIRRNYPVLTLLSAHGTLIASTPGSVRSIEDDFDTLNQV